MHKFEEDCTRFALCIQTLFQCDMLKKFGNDIVCTDSTHCMNQYNFPSTTLMVIGEYRELRRDTSSIHVEQ